MKRTASLIIFMLGLNLATYSQIDLLIPEGDMEIDTTLKDLSFHNFNLLEAPRRLNLSTDDQVAGIRAEQWETIEHEALPDYTMPIYQVPMEMIIPSVPIDTIIWRSPEIRQLPIEAGEKGDPK